MSIDLSLEADWKHRYAGEIMRLQNRNPDHDEAQGAFEQFGADHTPEECAWEDMIDGVR